MKKNLLLFFVLGLMIGFLNQCKSDRKNDSGFILKLRIKDEPDCLNPIVSQSGIATQIEALVMLPLFEYDMEKLELSPLMVEKMESPKLVNDSTLSYAYRIRNTARWDDGRPVTAADVAFTVKAALNPMVKNPNWRSALQNIIDVKGEGNELEVWVARKYLLSQEVSGNINIYPKHIYDPENHLQHFSIAALKSKDSSAFSPEQWEHLRNFASAFQSDSMCRTGISGAGPYALRQWEAGSKIVLEKKKNWWGQPLADSIPMLSQFPDRIEYLIIPEEASAVAALKEGSVDLVSDLSPKSFMLLKQDSNYAQRLQFFNEPGFGYNAIDVNTRKPGLQEREVRFALAHLLNVEAYIKNLAYGMASRVLSPIHPSRSYYNKNLEAISYNPNKCKEILKAGGWKDSDGDGVLDKKTKEGKVSLKFSLLVSAELGQKIALLFQEEAKKVGVEIVPEKKEMGQFMKEINERTFDLVATNISQSPSPYDPFQSWHSENAKPGGSNRCGITMPALDQTIDIIRLNPDQRNEAYLKFQEILFHEQVQWFLFSPHSRLVASEKIIFSPSKRKPGFLENMIREKK